MRLAWAAGRRLLVHVALSEIGVDAGQIGEAQAFAAAGQVAVAFGGDPIQRLDGLAALLEDQAAVFGQLRVPEIQLRAVAAAVTQPSQQGVALADCPVVLAQRAAVGRRYLAQGNIQVAASLRRRARPPG